MAPVPSATVPWMLAVPAAWAKRRLGATLRRSATIVRYRKDLLRVLVDRWAIRVLVFVAWLLRPVQKSGVLNRRGLYETGLTNVNQEIVYSKMGFHLRKRYFRRGRGQCGG